MDSGFRSYLTESFRQTFYLAGKQYYEMEIEGTATEVASGGSEKNSFLSQLSEISDNLSVESVKRLEQAGISDADGILRKQETVEKIMRLMEAELRSRLLQGSKKSSTTRK